MHRYQSFKWCNGLHNFSCNGWGDSGVQAKPEFVYQNCVKIIGHGGAHKHSCALKYMFRHKFPSYFSNYMLWSQKLKIRSKLSEWNCEEIFFPTNVCFLMWYIKWRCKQINKKKTFFVTKIFLLRECLCVENASITHRDHLFYFHYMESYSLFTDFKVILHVPIFGRFSFWAPTGFPEVIRPRYGLNGISDSCSIRNTHGAKLSPGVKNTLKYRS